MSSVRCWVLSHPGPVLRFRGADESWRAMMNLLSCWYYRHVGTTLPALWGVKERLLGDIEEFLGEDTRRWYKEIRREPVKKLLTLLTDTHWHAKPSREIQDLLKTVLLVLACPGSRLDSTRSTAFSTRGATFSTEFLDLARRRNWDCQTLLLKLKISTCIFQSIIVSIRSSAQSACRVRLIQAIAGHFKHNLCLSPEISQKCEKHCCPTKTEGFIYIFIPRMGSFVHPLTAHFWYPNPLPEAICIWRIQIWRMNLWELPWTRHHAIRPSNKDC